MPESDSGGRESDGGPQSSGSEGHRRDPGGRRPSAERKAAAAAGGGGGGAQAAKKPRLEVEDAFMKLDDMEAFVQQAERAAAGGSDQSGGWPQDPDAGRRGSAPGTLAPWRPPQNRLTHARTKLLRYRHISRTTLVSDGMRLHMHAQAVGLVWPASSVAEPVRFCAVHLPSVRASPALAGPFPVTFSASLFGHCGRRRRCLGLSSIHEMRRPARRQLPAIVPAGAFTMLLSTCKTQDARQKCSDVLKIFEYWKCLALLSLMMHRQCGSSPRLDEKVLWY